jgi:hypothetical protein
MKKKRTNRHALPVVRSLYPMYFVQRNFRLPQKDSFKIQEHDTIHRSYSNLQPFFDTINIAWNTGNQLLLEILYFGVILSIRQCFIIVSIYTIRGTYIPYVSSVYTIRTRSKCITVWYIYTTNCVDGNNNKKYRKPDLISSSMYSVNERCGQTLGTSSTYQNKKKYPYQHVSGNI